MADKKRKSQAEKAAAAAKKSSGKSNKASKQGKNAPAKKERRVPIRVISSLIFLSLFVLFTVIALWPEGAIVKALDKVIHGVFGNACFIISIPAFLYLFVIHAFSGKRPVCMRSVCIGFFVILCGCISHLFKFPGDTVYEVQSFLDLYNGGISGTTAGALCGFLTIHLCRLLGKAIFAIVFIVAAVSYKPYGEGFDPSTSL